MQKHVVGPMLAPHGGALGWLRSRSGSLAGSLSVPTSIVPLVFFRVAFGVLMFFSTLRFVVNGWVTDFYVTPTFHFTFLSLDWVRPLPEVGMYLVFVGMLILSVLIAVGAFYRPSMIGFFVLFTYVELLDKTYYLNHYYFISLLSFLLIFLPLHRAFSVDAWRRADLRATHVPLWTVGAIRLQLGLVYFFAGFAKIGPDWLLHGMPLRIWLPPHQDFPIIGQYFTEAWFALAMSWAGAFYDLTIPFWLSWRRTRYLAYLAVIGFHALTGMLFPIGMFPWIMIVATLIFFDARDYARFYGVLRRVLRVLPPRTFTGVVAANWSAPKRSRMGYLVLGVFFAVQVLLPLRHYLYPGDTNWTQEGFRFGWRVMLVESAGYVTYFVHDPASGKRWDVYPSQFLNTTQERQMSFQPDMIHEFALYLEQRFAADGYPDVEVRVEAYVTHNGRPSRLLIDPTVDLTQYPRSLFAQPWILP